MRQLFTLLLCFCGVLAVSAQERSLFDSLQYRAELQATLSGGDHNPLWLNANKYGLSSLKKANGYIRGAIMRPLSNDDGRRWGVGYGVDVALAAGFTSTLVIQQAYIGLYRGTLAQRRPHRRREGTADGAEEPGAEFRFTNIRHQRPSGASGKDSPS